MNDSSSQLKKDLEGVLSKEGRILRTELETICTTERIRVALDLEQSDGTITVIEKEGLRLFGVLALCGHLDRIVQLIKNGIKDNEIFHESDDRPFCVKESLTGIDGLDGIDDQIVEFQWKIPLRLGRDHKCIPNARFLEYFPACQAENYFASGSWAKVYKVVIEPGYVECESYSPHDLVWKKVRFQRSVTDERIRAEVDVLRKRQHPHIIPLLASFETIEVYSQSPERYLYIVLPFAQDGDMETWIHRGSAPDYLKGSTYDETLHNTTEFLLKTCYSLFSALAFIHKPLDKVVGFHHDLKPRNILLFRRHSEIQFKISDFGTAQLNFLHDGSERPAKDVGTYDYHPPECYHGNEWIQSVSYGRSFDIFGMGCIALQLASIIIAGWKSISAFDKFRESNESTASFRQEGSEHDESFHNNMPAVRKWCEDLKTKALKAEEPWRLQQLLSVVDECLVEDRKSRIFAWEVKIDLFEIGSGPPSQTELRNEIIDSIESQDENPDPERHNPLERAKRLGKSFLEGQLRRKGWRKPSHQQPRVGSVAKAFTNLPGGFGRLIGRTEHIEDIKRHLKKLQNRGRIGIHGIGGIGKSHLAYQYAANELFFEEASAWSKNRFWINAINRSTFEESLREIACAINLTPDASTLKQDVKMWLNNENNGAWILVIDGLHDERTAVTISEFLPSWDRGQTIITSRTKRAIRELQNGQSDPPIIELREMRIEDARSLLWRTFVPIKSDAKHQDRLLSVLGLPLLIIKAANYLKETNDVESPIRRLNELLNSQMHDWNYADTTNPPLPLGTSNGFYPLKLLLLDPFIKQDKTGGEELQLLEYLSCCAKDYLRLDLVPSTISTKAQAQTHLIRYMDNGFISVNRTIQVSHDIGPKHYNMPEMIQQCLLHDMREQHESKGPTYILMLYNHLLEALKEAYDEKRASNIDNKRVQRDSYLWKTEFMPHFEQFLSYIRQNPFNYFDFSTKAANSILVFARAFSNQHRYKDAIHVLRLLCKFGIEESSSGQDAAHEVRANTFFELSAIYKEMPTGRNQKNNLEKSLKYADQAVKAAKMMNSPAASWRPRLQVIEIQIELADNPKFLARCHQRIQELREDVSIHNDIQTLLTEKTIIEQRKQGITNDEIKFAIRLGEAEAEAYFHEGKGRSKILVFKAREKYQEILRATNEFQSMETHAIDQVKERLARVDLQIPVRGALEEALLIYNEKVHGLESQSDGSHERPNFRTLDNQYSRAVARTRLASILHHGGEIELAKTAFEEAQRELIYLCDVYENAHGKQKGSPARLVAYALRDLYHCTLDLSRAKTLEECWDLKELRLPFSLGPWFPHGPNPDSTVEWPVFLTFKRAVET